MANRSARIVLTIRGDKVEFRKSGARGVEDIVTYVGPTVEIEHDSGVVLLAAGSWRSIEIEWENADEEG